MRKKTAVEWLVEQLFQTNNNTTDSKKMDSESIIQQAKEMEEEQHQETFKQSRLAKIFEKDFTPVWESWEQYYNKTFKSE